MNALFTFAKSVGQRLLHLSRARQVGACVTTAVIATVLLGFVNDAFDLRERFGGGNDRPREAVLAEAKAKYEAESSRDDTHP